MDGSSSSMMRTDGFPSRMIWRKNLSSVMLFLLTSGEQRISGFEISRIDGSKLDLDEQICFQNDPD